MLCIIVFDVYHRPLFFRSLFLDLESFLGNLWIVLKGLQYISLPGDSG